MKTGYARILHALAVAKRPPPTRFQDRDRVATLLEFIARGVMPEKFPTSSKKTWRGSLDPTGMEAELSADSPRLPNIEKFVNRQTFRPRQLQLQLQIMVLEAKIYTWVHKTYEITVNQKYPGPVKHRYRDWVSEIRCTTCPRL